MCRMTPVKEQKTLRSKFSESCKSENLNPNVSVSPLDAKSPSVASAKSKKPAARNPNRNGPLPIQERKFFVAKKNSAKEATRNTTCKCKDKHLNIKKCPCVAYESLRESQEKFFKNRTDEVKTGDDGEISVDGKDWKCNIENDDGVVESQILGDPGSRENGSEVDFEEFKLSDGRDTTRIRKVRHRLLEEARSSIPETGSGMVLHLVKAFEKLVTIPNSKESTGKEGADNAEKGKATKWALPGLQRTKSAETEVPSSSFSPPAFVFSSKTSDSASSVYSSIDSTTGSIGSRTSGGGRRSGRNSSSSGRGAGSRKWQQQQQLRSTNQQPFKLRTEKRGMLKQEEFQKKVEEMLMEEKKQRTPIAQGLPWTTDEPENLVRPPVKENTRPYEIQLHSDVRAVERAEFDYHVAEKLSVMEKYRLERERQQKLEEEEEIKRLRRELVPRAQPMPYFDRPFVPKRSEKLPTMPKEPRLNVPQQKKIKCMSWNDLNCVYHHDQ
ncbi:microtubule-destabilizing protein 60-like [Aristolochia californica]|uniref:microtubule-destabilizing protein 60-like n=1 Tax=Aristolochia californica TaxID=171875 RepID=UPI0035DDBD41